MNTENSEVDLQNLSADLQNTNNKLEIGKINKARLQQSRSGKVGDKNKTPGEQKEVPIFKSLRDSNVFIDLVRFKHPYFTRHVRYTLIFMDIFFSMLLIACLMRLCYPVINDNENVLMYAIGKVWIPILTSIGTQIIIFGTVTLLRWNERNFLNVRNFTNYEDMNVQLKQTKKIRYPLFYTAFLTLFISLYSYYVFEMVHANSYEGVWLLLTLFALILDFIVSDFILIMIQLWLQGISVRFESKIRNLRLLRVAKEAFVY